MIKCTYITGSTQTEQQKDLKKVYDGIKKFAPTH